MISLCRNNPAPNLVAGQMRVFCRSQIHKDLCHLMFCEEEISGHFEVDIYMGGHRYLFSRLAKDRYSVGVQTEQYYDARGARLWGLKSRLVPWLMAAKFDTVLDFSEYNRKAYPRCFVDNLLIGPYIFNHRAAFSYSDNGVLLHIGSPSSRRAKVIEEISTPVKSSFGSVEKLSRLVGDCTGLLNIHYASGDYIEWPRFLLAYTFGKIVYSEKLPEPLKEGRHYAALGNRITPREKEKIFYNFHNEIALCFSVRRLILELESRSLEKTNRVKKFYLPLAAFAIPVLSLKRIWGGVFRRLHALSERCVKALIREC